MLVVVFYGFYAFVSQGQWIKISYPAILLLSGYVLITTRRFLLTERKKELVEAESIETNKMLGLSFQGQGMLDLAFEKFRKCPIDESMKEILYNLALDYERKRQFNKAVNVYEHIATVDPKYRDIQDRMKILRRAGEAMQMPLKTGKEGTLIVEGLPQRPTLGRYEIIKELGRGAMGVVYLAKDPKINRTVAIKTIELGGDLEQAERQHIITRFYREAEAAGKLSHPNIIKVYDAGEEEDLAYLAIEYLEGEDLKKYCVKGNLLPLEKAIEVVMKVADALAYAHSQGVVHRDIKPANIMLLKNGDVRVTDFGIARISGSTATQTGTVLGTPSYMSPEQIAGKRVDGRSDIFSLGVVLYELLTGKKPFESESITTLMYKITNEKHEDPRKYNPAIPESCVKIIDKALEKLPENRYQSASAMANDLKKCLETLLSYKKQQQTPPQKQKT
jgi:serine/threonine-protein kinase